MKHLTFVVINEVIMITLQLTGGLRDHMGSINITIMVSDL